jgi:hypothetical protein
MVGGGYEKIIEVGVAKEIFDLNSRKSLLVGVALWEGGLPVEILPIDGMLDIPLGAENFAWELQ